MSGATVLELAARRVEVLRAAVPKRLGRRCSYGVRQARVERPLCGLQAGARARELALQLEHAVAARPALRERGAQQEQDAAGADDEADEERSDRHEGIGP